MCVQCGEGDETWDKSAEQGKTLETCWLRKGWDGYGWDIYRIRTGSLSVCAIQLTPRECNRVSIAQDVSGGEQHTHTNTPKDANVEDILFHFVLIFLSDKLFNDLHRKNKTKTAKQSTLKNMQTHSQMLGKCETIWDFANHI